MMTLGKPQYSMRIKKYRLTTDITTSWECPQIERNASGKEEKLNSKNHLPISIYLGRLSGYLCLLTYDRTQPLVALLLRS